MSCVSDGIDDKNLLQYRDMILLPQKYGSSRLNLFLPVFASHSLSGEPNAHITHALIIVHGLAGDANTYFCDSLRLVQELGVNSSTLVIAPWFGDQKVTPTQWMVTPRKGADVSAFWDTSRWLIGGNNSPEPARYTTSFDCLDDILEAVTPSEGAQSVTPFPNLHRVSLGGFSAGAQLLSRWAFFSPALMPQSAPNQRRTAVISDGSTYLYVTDARPAQECVSLNNTGPTHSCSHFVRPSTANCPQYDEYKYGLDGGNLSGVTKNMYEILLFCIRYDIIILKTNPSYEDLADSHSHTACQPSNLTNRPGELTIQPTNHTHTRTHTITINTFVTSPLPSKISSPTSPRRPFANNTRYITHLTPPTICQQHQVHRALRLRPITTHCSFAQHVSQRHSVPVWAP